EFLESRIDVLEPVFELLFAFAELDGRFTNSQLHPLQFLAPRPVLFVDLLLDLGAKFGDDSRVILFARAGVKPLAGRVDLALDLLPALVPDDAIGLQLAGLFLDRLGPAFQLMSLAFPFVQSGGRFSDTDRFGYWAGGRARNAIADGNV